MAKAGFTGPLLSLGTLAGGMSGSQPREYSDELGPSIVFGGFATPVITGNASKDRMGPGAIPAVFCASPIRTVNASISVNGALTTAGPAVAGVALPNLTTYTLGRAPAPTTVAGVSVNGIALDMGLDTAVYVIGPPGTATLSVIANAWRYRVGQWICLLNGGVAGAPLMTQITAIVVSTGVITVSPAPLAAATGQIALTNRFNPNLYGASGPPSGVASTAAAGTARIIIPEVGNTRGLGITSVAGATQTIFDVVGTDGTGLLQTETITGATTATTVWSKKTYDMFISATPRTADAGHNYTVVTSDFIGFPLPVLSADSIVAATRAGTAIAPTADYTIIPADLTFPISPTTGDPRGGIQTTANGPGVAPTTPVAFANSVLIVDQRLNPLQVALGGY